MMADPSVAVPLVEKGYQVSNTGYWAAPLTDEETPELVWPLSISVYDRMRRQEAQVVSVLRAVILPILRTQWRVDGAGAKAGVTQLVAEDLGLPIEGREMKPWPRTRDRFSWIDHLRHALLMLPHGHSFFEQTYRYDAQNRARLRKLGWRPPKTIQEVKVAADGGLEWITQSAALGVRHKPEPIPVTQLVAYVNEREGGNWLGQSLLRPAYKFWLLKDRALRTGSMSLDRNGLGVPIYENGPHPEGLDPEEAIRREKAEMVDGLKMAKAYRGGENAGGAIRNGAKLTLKGVEGKLPDPLPFIRYCDELMAHAVLANFLNLGGENSTGSYALGETFADFFVQSLQTVAMHIADIATQHIVEDLVDLNFGPDEPAPRIVFDEIGGTLSAASLKLLIDAAVITPDEPLERFARSRFALPAADPTTARGSGTTPRELTEMVQKVYLGVDKVISAAEARQFLIEAGADIPVDPTFDTTPDPQASQTEGAPSEATQSNPEQ